MLKSFRRKVICIQLVSFLAVTAIILFAINVVARQQVQRSAHQMLKMLSQNDGKMPVDDFEERNEKTHTIIIGDETYEIEFGNDISVETPYSIRYFSIYVDGEGNVIHYDLTHIAAISEHDVDFYVKTALASPSKESSIGYYRFLKKTEDDVTQIYFMDCYSKYMYVTYLMRWSLFLMGICIFLDSLIVYYLSGIVIGPIVENFKRQKQFYADASHELKTPVAAIQANVDVLELVSGSNEITEKIKRQTKQLGKLINEMLTLTKLEDRSVINEECTDFDLSQMLKLQTEDIEARAAAENKTIKVEIEENIVYRGIENDIYKLCSILLDNAVKYCQESGTIIVSLKNDRKCRKIIVHNTCKAIPSQDLEHLFDRFYRGDETRNRDSGSYGIGLSIAKAIVEGHKGRINARNEDDGVTFEVVLP